MCLFGYRNGNAKSEANPFEEGDDGEWDEGDAENILVDNGEPGVPVKALYDYDGAESDELTFKQGNLHAIILWIPSGAQRFFEYFPLSLKSHNLNCPFVYRRSFREA